MKNRDGLRPISVFLLVAIWLKLQYFLEKLPFAGNSSTISKMHLGVCSLITIDLIIGSRNRASTLGGLTISTSYAWRLGRFKFVVF